MTKPITPDLSEFQAVDFDGNLLTDESGNAVYQTPPNTRSLEAVKALIAQGKPEKAIKANYASYQLGKKWQYFKDVQEIDAENTTIEAERERIAAANAALQEGESPQELPEYKENWPDANAEEYQTVDYDTWKLENYTLFRAVGYPSWEAQLEHIYDHGVDSWKINVIDPVKRKYPKPS